MESPVPADHLNRAIQDHYPLMWSDEVEDAFRAAIGANGLALVEEIRHFSNTAEQWMYGDHDAAYQSMQTLLLEKYPFLTEASVIKIATSAAWGWR